MGKNPAQVSVSTTAKQILAQDTTRTSYELVNITSGVNVFLGPTNAVTATTGHALIPNFPVKRSKSAGDDVVSAVYGITASGTATVTVEPQQT